MSSTADVLRAITALAQATFVIGAAIWAFYAYRQARRGQVRISIECTPRLSMGWMTGRALLIISVRVTNTSGVLYRHREATATLMDAQGISSAETARLVPFGQADPFPPVYEDISDDEHAIERGETFTRGRTQITLEPGEHIDSEVAFILDEDRLGVMAVRVLIMGSRGTWREWIPRNTSLRRLRPQPAWWGTFFYVDPAHVAGFDLASIGQPEGSIVI